MSLVKENRGQEVAGRGANNSGSVWLVKRKTLPDYWRGAVTLRDGSKKYVQHVSREACQALVDDLVGRVKNREPVRSATSSSVKTEVDKWLIRRSSSRMGKKVKLTASSVRTYRVAIDRIINRSDGMRQCLGKMQADEVTSHDVRMWLDDAYAANLSGSYLRQGFSALTQTFQTLVEEGVIPVNPCTSVHRPDRKVTNGRGVEKKQLRALLRAVKNDRLSLRWLIALQLGVRPAEAVAIRRQDVDLSDTGDDGEREGVLTIRGQIDTRGIYIDHTKGKDPRYLPLDEELVEAFERHFDAMEQEKAAWEAAGKTWNEYYQGGQHHDFVFRMEDGSRITVSKDTRRWGHLLEQASLPPMVRYIARHTAASHMIGQGIDALTAAELLGHKNPWMTLNVYGHALTDSRKKAVAKMSATMNATARKGYEEELTSESPLSQLEDLLEQLEGMGLSTTEVEAKIAAEKNKGRGGRPRRTPRATS